MAERITFDNAWFGSESAVSSELAPDSDWTAMRSTDHFVQFYETDEFLTSSVAEYVFHGLRTGETCIVIATPEHREAMELQLAKFMSRLPRRSRASNYVALDARETLEDFMAGGVPDAAKFEKTVGSLIKKTCSRGPVRAFGEMVALLVADENPDAALELERLWNAIRERYAFSLYCAYPVEDLALKGRGFMPELCGHHSRVIPSESYAALTTAGERLRAVAFLQHRTRQLEAELAVLQHRISTKKGGPVPAV